MSVTKPGNMRFFGLRKTGGAGISSIFPSRLNTQQKAAAADLSIRAEAR
jgi:hypothetical protein